MRSFKKIAAMIMAVAMLCSFTALANDAGVKVELNAITAPDTDNPTVTLGYTADTNAAQTTMLVYKGENLAGADIVYVNQFAEGASPVELRLGTDADDYGTYTVVAGGMDVDTAYTTTFNHSLLAYDVTLTKTAGGTVTKDYAGNFNNENTLVDVLKNTEITFGFTPYVGYELTSVTVDGEAVSVDKTGDNLTITVTDDTVIDVTFTEAVAEEVAQAFTSAGIYDVPANEAAEDEDKLASKLVFGKAIAPNGGEIIEAGMYLEKWVEEEGAFKPFIASKEATGGPYFKANGRTADNKYGIRFFRFEAGRYQVRSYVKYGPNDSDVEYGAPVEFVVD